MLLQGDRAHVVAFLFHEIGQLHVFCYVVAGWQGTWMCSVMLLHSFVCVNLHTQSSLVNLRRSVFRGT